MKNPMVSFQKNERRQGAKTDTWEVWGVTSSFHIGQVRWLPPWRKYCFFPDSSTIWDEECLRSVATFLEWETKKHRAGKRSFAQEAPA